jgi:hypothetical protein
VKESEPLIALEPEVVVATTSTTPTPLAGVVAEHEVVLQVTPVAAVPPKVIDVPLGAVEKFDPVTVTFVPPAVEPELGLTDVTVGGGA